MSVVGKAVVTESASAWTDRRRRRSASLSVLAAGTTAATFAWDFFAIARDSDPSPSVRLWLVIIATPAIAVSTTAAAQYRWGRHTGAGAAAMAVLWVLVAIFFGRATGMFLPAAVLQTAAWFTSRPRTAVPAAR